MADENAAELIKRGDKRFSKRSTLDSLRQEIALNFAPWHASWTTEIQWGDEFCSHLVDGTPLLMARDFTGQVGAMLRPPGKQWFWHRSPLDSLNNNRRVREYLDWRSMQQMRIMTDRVTGFMRATKQADEFFSMFGDGVMSVDVAEDQATLRFRTWHTKDCVWAVGSENRVDTISRREMVPARVLKQRFGEKKLHDSIKRACEKDPDQEFPVSHEVLPAGEYDAYKPGMKRKAGQFASVWVDVTNKVVLRETTTPTFRYAVPRWVTLPGNPYAISPATTIALPDARLIQQQALAILEAAEKQINPPIMAYHDALRGDARLESRAINYVDRGYDERTGVPIQPIELAKNFRLGVDSLMRTEAMLAKAFFLDVLRMPDTRNSKSTLEVQFKIDEYVRAALPLFAPMQSEYNEALLYEADMLIELAGGYNGREKPDELRDIEMTYQWDNPLADMMERQKAQTVAEVGQLGQAVAALEAAAQQAPALQQIDTGRMFRESAMGIGAASWILDEDSAAEKQKGTAQQNQMREMVGAAPNIAQLIKAGSDAASVAAEIPNPSEPGVPLLPMPM